MPTEEILNAFILFNERESSVPEIVNALEARNVKTYFWRRDIPVGESWEQFEEGQLKKAQTVILLLGEAGWGPNHHKLTELALNFRKRVLPVLIGDPPEKSMEEFEGLFIKHRHLDLRQISDELLDRLATEILQRDDGNSAGGDSALESRKVVQIERIVGQFINGNKEQRDWALRQVIKSEQIDKDALAARLREEISGRFSPKAETDGSAGRTPKEVSSIRSWMMSCLIWADGSVEANKNLILNHLSEQIETDHNVRFWTLAGLYHRKADYLNHALQVTQDDSAADVRSLQKAIAGAGDEKVISSFKRKLDSPDFRQNWEVLRVLRVVSFPELTESVCDLLQHAVPNSAAAYDSLYALSNSQTAPDAAKILSERLGPEKIVELVIVVSGDADRTALRNFCVLLVALDPQKVNAVLRRAQGNPQLETTATILFRELSEFRTSGVANQVFMAGYASDAIDIKNDQLDIQEDVQTLVAVMLAKEVEPPLAIGLFGDWGSGKSFFMKSMRAAVDELAEKSIAPESKFRSNIVQIEFNAWHYIDANLWASLVSYILEQLAAYVAPEKSEDEQQAALLVQLSTAKTIVAEAEAEKAGAQAVIDDRQAALQELQLKRQEAEVKLADLRFSDLATLLSENETLKTDLQNSLNEVGAPAALERLSDLSGTVSEAHSLRGRVVALFLAVQKGKNKTVLIGLVLFVLLVVPLVAWLLHQYVFTSDLLVTASAIVAQLTGIIAGVTVVLRRAFDTANKALTKVEEAKQRVDKLLAEKRQTPSQREKDLQNEIASLKAQEQEASARVVAAAARVVELESQIRAIKEGRSLARFLGERVRSEDYRKHLGLISTIRKDFESLATRLTNARKNPEPGFRAADRIILYIDDLDRCPTDRVMDVLQAVHLLLAYPLFIVVVGVDPRWLLHSLGSTYGAFDTSSKHDDSDAWRTTPQNYLEKIFQIPFNLRPMTDTGYTKLVSKLLTSNGVGLSPSKVTAPEKLSSTPDISVGVSDPPPSPTNIPGGQSASTGNETPPQETKKAEAKRAFEIQDEALVINEWEAQFAVKLFSLIPNPRATKRFSNIYRILKAHVRREALREFEGTAAFPGDFQIAMMLLALLVGAPDACAVLFPKLKKWALEGKDAMEILHNLESSGLDAETAEALNEKLRPIISDAAFPNTPELFLEWLPRVSRFSFEVGRVIQPIAAPFPS